MTGQLLFKFTYEINFREMKSGNNYRALVINKFLTKWLQ